MKGWNSEGKIVSAEELDEEFVINTITDNQLNYAVKLLSG